MLLRKLTSSRAHLNKRELYALLITSSPSIGLPSNGQDHEGHRVPLFQRSLLHLLSMDKFTIS
jgi:hypothetical protein